MMMCWTGGKSINLSSASSMSREVPGRLPRPRRSYKLRSRSTIPYIYFLAKFIDKFPLGVRTATTQQYTKKSVQYSTNVKCVCYFVWLQMDDSEVDYPVIEPDEQKIDHLVSGIQKKFGLELLGIDVIIENGTGRYGVIDINAFPGTTTLVLSAALSTVSYFCIFRCICGDQ